MVFLPEKKTHDFHNFFPSQTILKITYTSYFATQQMDSAGTTLNAITFRTYLSGKGRQEKRVRVETSRLASLRSFSYFLFQDVSCDVFVVQRDVQHNLAVYWTQDPAVLYALFRDLSEGTFDPWVALMRKEHHLNLRPKIFPEERAFFVRTNQFLSDLELRQHIRYEDLLTHCKRFFYAKAPKKEFFDTLLMYARRPIFDCSIEKGLALFYIKCVLIRIEAARRSNDVQTAWAQFQRLRSYVEGANYQQFRLNYFSTGYIDIDTLAKAPFGVALALSDVARFQPFGVSDFSVNQAYVYLNHECTNEELLSVFLNPTRDRKVECVGRQLGLTEVQYATSFKYEGPSCKYWQPGTSEAAIPQTTIVAIRIDSATLTWDRDRNYVTNKNPCLLERAGIFFNGKRLTVIWDLKEKVQTPREIFQDTPYVRTKSGRKVKYLKMKDANLCRLVGYNMQQQRLEWTNGPLVGRPFVPGTAFLTDENKRYTTVLECKFEYPELKLVMPRWQPSILMDYTGFSMPSSCMDLADQWVSHLHRKGGNVTFAIAFMAMERRLGWPGFASSVAAQANRSYVPHRRKLTPERHAHVEPLDIIRQLNTTPPEMHDDYKHHILGLVKSPFHPFWIHARDYQDALSALFPELLAMQLSHFYTTQFSPSRVSNSEITAGSYYGMLAAAINQSAFEYGGCTCVLLTRELYKIICNVWVAPEANFARLFARRTIFIPTFVVRDAGETVTFHESLLTTKTIEKMVHTTLQAAAYHVDKHIWPHVWTEDTTSEVVGWRLDSVTKILSSKCPSVTLDPDTSSLIYRESPVELEPSPCTFSYVPHTSICVVSYDLQLRAAPREDLSFDSGVSTTDLRKLVVRFALWPHVEKYDHVLNGGTLEEYEEVPPLRDDSEAVIPVQPKFRISVNPV